MLRCDLYSKSENDQEPQNVVFKVWKTQGFLVTVKAAIVHINWSGRKGWNQGNFPKKKENSINKLDQI